MPGSAEANPFVGPRPLAAGERLWGRDREVRELDNEISAERVVVLCSPSGAGKSSLVQAGLLQRLAEFFDVWGPARVHLPAAGTNRYVASVVRSFEEEVPEPLRRPPADLAGQTLAEYVAERPHRQAAPRSRLLVFDQFEEVLTVDPLAAAAKRAFFDQLGELLAEPRNFALFVLREDYLVALDPYAQQVPTHLKNRFRLDLLDLASARSAMENPARDAGRTFPAAEELARDLAVVQVQQADGTFAEEAGLYVEPVQLQVVCHRLWASLPADATTIGIGDLQRFGDVNEALGSYYDDAVARVAGGDAGRLRAIRDFFGEHLVTAAGIRGQVVRGAGETVGLDDETVQALLDTHLLRAEQRGGATWYELAHDRLIAPVRESNAAWRSAHLAEFQHRARVWEREGRPRELLLADDALAAAETQAAGTVLNNVERRFLKRSRQDQEIREHRQRQAAFIRGLAAAVMLALAVGGLVASWQWRIAEEERAAAENVTRAAVAANLLGTEDAAAGNLLVLEVEDPAGLEVAMDALHQALADPIEEAVLEGHSGDVEDAAWSGDGQRVATVSLDGTARVWDAATGRTIAILEGHADELLAVAWSPDGERLVTTSRDHTARLWDPAGTELAVLEGHANWVTHVAWSSDGRSFATVDSYRYLIVWDAAGRQRWVQRPAGKGNEKSRVAWSDDGRFLATSLTQSEARIWNAADGDLLALLEGHDEPVVALAWDGAGRRLVTASQDATARVWTLSEGRNAVDRVTVLEGHANWVVDAAWSHGGERVVTASDDGKARIWDAVTGESLVLLEGHTDFVNSARWSADDRWVATASDDRTLRLWRASDGAATAVLRGHTDQVYGATWEPGGERLLSLSVDRTARLWQPFAFGEELLVLRGHHDNVLAFWGPAGQRVLTASADGTARIWEWPSGRQLQLLVGHTEGLEDASWSPDGTRVATASADATVRIWNPRGEAVAILGGHADVVRRVRWSPDGTRVATASLDGTARVWEVAAETPRGPLLLEHADFVISLAWSSDGKRLATGCLDHQARLWNLANAGAELLEGHEGGVHEVLWSPDENRLLTTSYDGTARIWDVDGRRTTAVLEHDAEILSAAWSVDGRHVATGSWDLTAAVWDAATGERLAVLDHGVTLTGVAWSEDSTRLATAAADGKVRIWEASAGLLQATLHGHRTSVATLTWRGNDRLLTGSFDGTARIWAVPETAAGREASARHADLLRGRVRARSASCLEPAFQPRRLAVGKDEGRRRSAACEACLPSFFERLDGAPYHDGEAYEAAWTVYETCFQDVLER